jgi:CRP-like cAMP-binding protein
VLGPHTFFGEMALVANGFGTTAPQDSTAEAVNEALICVLRRSPRSATSTDRGTP